VSSEYDKENFLPQTLDIEWDDPQFGSFYMGPNEKARIWKMKVDGHTWMDTCEITWLDIWGAGFDGVGTLRSEWDTVQFSMESYADNDWYFDGGSWNVPGSCVFDKVLVKGNGGVAVSYSQVGDVSNSGVESDNGCLELFSGQTLYVKCGTTKGHTSDLPIAPIRGTHLIVMTGSTLEDDIGINPSKRTVQASATYTYGYSFTERTVDSYKEGDGEVTIGDGVVIESINCKFDSLFVKDDTTGAGYYVDSIGSGGDWIVTYDPWRFQNDLFLWADEDLWATKELYRGGDDVV
jgi:hypothetical protein